MDALLSVSILIRCIVLARSLLLWRRLENWRLGVLSGMIFLMTLRQVLTLIEHATSALGDAQRWSLIDFTHTTELPGLGVSVLALLGIVQLERWLTGLSRAEKALRRTERSLTRAQRIAHLGNWDLDLVRNELWWSDEVYRMFGVQPQEFEATYEAFLARVHPADRERVDASNSAALANQRPHDIDHRIVLPDGTERVVHEKAEVFFDADGKPVRMVGTVHDVTDQKRAQEAIRRSERSLAEAQRIAHIGNWDWDLQTDAQQLSDEIYRIIGLDPQELEVTFQHFLAAVHPDDRAGVQHALQRTLEDGDPYDIEFRVIRPDGGERILHTRAEVTYDMDGKPASLFGTAQDVTHRERAEAALRESEEKYRTLFEHSPAGIGITDAEGRILAMNDAMLEPGGYSREDIAQETNVVDFYYDPTDRMHIFAELEKHGVVRQREVRMKRKDGTPYIVSLSVVPTHIDQEPTFLAIAEDVTDRREVEEAYRASTELQRLVLSQVDEIVFSTTFPPGQFFAGKLDFVSPKLESILGYTPEDFHNDPDLWLREIHPDDMAGLKRTTEQVLQNRTAGTREYRFRHKKTGAYRWIEDQFVPRLDDHGQVTGLFGASRDVTRRKQAEDELRRSREALRRLAIREQAVPEEERTSIAREIHDQLGQAMTALRMELSWLHRKLAESSSEVSERTQSMLSMIGDATATVQDLSSRLRPAALDDLGLPAAVEWQVREFGSRTDIQCAVEVPPTGLDLDPDRATGLFRILQEALTNVARHAEASEVDIRLQVNGADLVLRVQDNGKGISKSEVSSSDSYGLLGMRERAIAMRGSVTIEPSSAGGTTVIARVPM